MGVRHEALAGGAGLPPPPRSHRVKEREPAERESENESANSAVETTLPTKAGGGQVGRGEGERPIHAASPAKLQQPGTNLHDTATDESLGSPDGRCSVQVCPWWVSSASR